MANGDFRRLLRPALRPHPCRCLVSLLVLILLGGCAGREARMSMQKVGPQKGTVGNPVEYSITLNNVGDGRATDVVVRDMVPGAMTYVASSPVGRYDAQAGAVSWTLGTLEAGAGATVGVTLRGETTGQQCNVARVEAADGVSGTARTCTMFAGLPDVRVSVRSDPDPVEAGFTTTYTLELENRGSATALGVRVSGRVPKGLAYVSASGPAPSRVVDDVVVFDPLPALPPNSSVPYRIVARAETPGLAAFEAQVEADHLSTPMRVGRRTRVVGDAAAPPGPRAPRRLPATGAHLGDQDRIGRLVSVANVLVRGRALTGRIVNKSARTISGVHLRIRSVWLWDDEKNPGSDDPSTAVLYRVPGEVPARGFLPFFYRPLPIPPRAGGRYETRVSIAEFSEVP